MRPCHACGAALQNNVVTCPDCGASPQGPASLPAAPPLPVPERISHEDRALWFEYLFFPVLTAIVAGIFGVVLWGWIGVLLALPIGIVALMIRIGIDLI